MKEDVKKSKGFTFVEVTIVIAIIGILAAVALPSYINIARQAHIANMKAVEGSVAAWVTMKAAENLANTDKWNYPLALMVAGFTETNILKEDLDNWADGSDGVLIYSGGKGGSITYTTIGIPPVLYSIDLIYDGVPL